MLTQHLLPALFTAAGPGGCSGPATSGIQAAWPLEGTCRQLVSLNGQALEAQMHGREPYLLLQTSTLRVAGRSGCNRFSGGDQTQGSALKRAPSAGTPMACMAGMELETGFPAASRTVVAWRVRADRLQLLDPDSRVRAEFASGSPRYAPCTARRLGRLSGCHSSDAVN